MTEWFHHFARILFWRNFAYAKSRENKTLVKISEFTVSASFNKRKKGQHFPQFKCIFVLDFLIHKRSSSDTKHGPNWNVFNIICLSCISAPYMKLKVWHYLSKLINTSTGHLHLWFHFYRSVLPLFIHFLDLCPQLNLPCYFIPPEKWSIC